MTAVEVVPKLGLRFEHARFRQCLPGVRVSQSPPEVFVVTAIRGGLVYYGPPGPRLPRKGRKASHYIAVASFATVVGKVLEAEEENGDG